MTDLVAFLLERIAEDEASARRAAEGLAVMNATGLQVMGREVYIPARVLAECDAKRQIVEAAAIGLDFGGQSNWAYDPYEDHAPEFAEFVLAALALPYADHPAFREEWR